MRQEEIGDVVESTVVLRRRPDVGVTQRKTITIDGRTMIDDQSTAELGQSVAERAQSATECRQSAAEEKMIDGVRTAESIEPGRRQTELIELWQNWKTEASRSFHCLLDICEAVTRRVSFRS